MLERLATSIAAVRRDHPVRVAIDGVDGAGKTILEFRKNQHVFEQGDVADTVFYIQKGKVKLTVVSEQGKEAVIYSVDPIARRYRWLPLAATTVHTMSFDERFDCTIVVDCARLGRPDVATVDAIARLALAARQGGLGLSYENAPPSL